MINNRIVENTSTMGRCQWRCGLSLKTDEATLVEPTVE
jgi:hypothetical protein